MTGTHPIMPCCQGKTSSHVSPVGPQGKRGAGLECGKQSSGRVTPGGSRHYLKQRHGSQLVWKALTHISLTHTKGATPHMAIHRERNRASEMCVNLHVFPEYPPCYSMSIELNTRTKIIFLNFLTRMSLLLMRSVHLDDFSLVTVTPYYPYLNIPQF